MLRENCKIKRLNVYLFSCIEKNKFFVIRQRVIYTYLLYLSVSRVTLRLDNFYALALNGLMEARGNLGA